MQTALKYGNDEILLNIPEKNVLGVLEPTGLEPLVNLKKEVMDLLDSPTNGPGIAEIVHDNRIEKVAVIVNDLTRSTPTSRLLPPVLDKLLNLGIERNNIDIVIATGTHRPMTEEEIKTITGEDIYNNYRITNHDCEAKDLVKMGTLKGGNDLWINPIVAAADLRIGIGEILLHYYAGFAGGRKSIFPGVAGKKTIMDNHRMMTYPGVGIGITEGNPVSEQMVEAIERLCPLHFIINCICDSHKNVVSIVSGHAVRAWQKGIEIFRKMNFAEIGKKADVLFVSAGGFPKDINMYQAHKALEMCSRAVKEGGSIVFFAELSEGHGHPVFEEWARKGMSPEEAIREFERNFRFGAHKLYYLARVARKCEIYLYSDMNAEESEEMYCKKINSVDEIIPGLREKYGEDFTAWIIPQGGIVLPVVEAKG